MDYQEIWETIVFSAWLLAAGLAAALVLTAIGSLPS